MGLKLRCTKTSPEVLSEEQALGPPLRECDVVAVRTPGEVRRGTYILSNPPADAAAASWGLTSAFCLEALL